MKKYFTWHDQLMKYKLKIPCIILCIRNPYFLFHTLTRVIQRVPLVQELFNRGYELVTVLEWFDLLNLSVSVQCLVHHCLYFPPFLLVIATPFFFNLRLLTTLLVSSTHSKWTFSIVRFQSIIIKIKTWRNYTSKCTL